jgi:hypothetical protein
MYIREAKCIFETKFYGLKAHDQKASKWTYLRSLLLKRVAFKEYEAYFSKSCHSTIIHIITHIMIKINVNNYHQKILE